MRRRRAGISMGEILIVVAVVAVLAAILIPYANRSRNNAELAACASNLRELGRSMILYATDNNAGMPGGKPGPSVVDGAPAMLAWGQEIYPYAGTPDVYKCAQDPTAATAGNDVVSYAVNSNLSMGTVLSEAPTIARTVMFFEVSGSSSAIQFTGDHPSKTAVSAAGDGTNTGLFSTSTGPGTVLYATGTFANAGPASRVDTFRGREPRHGGGANYLALDGHGVWAPAEKISAGRSAAQPTSPESKSGCKFLGVDAPCAAGAAEAGHVLSFSTR
ncbi:MAG: hypothetical protein J0H02_01475 [Armatimonadetes bacterium]|nr:hypothetical protein [Armatimonadota bacterium]